MKQSATIIGIVLLFIMPSTASAQLFGLAGNSPRSHQIEIKFGGYTPNIDSEPGVNAYEVIFEDESMVMSRFEYDYQFWQGFGSLALGFELGYGSVTGKGQEIADDSSDTIVYAGQSSDDSSLNLLPFSVSLVYHFDTLMTRWNIPLVPFIKGGLDYTVWWITDGVDKTSEFEGSGGKKFKGSGDTLGWHIASGIKLCLDGFAPNMAKTFDNEIGVNNSYLFAEFLHADINDFGSKKSFQLGDTTVQFGIAFEY